MKEKEACKLQLWDFVPYAGLHDYRLRNSNNPEEDSLKKFIRRRELSLVFYNRAWTAGLAIGGAFGLAKLIRR